MIKKEINHRKEYFVFLLMFILSPEMYLSQTMSEPSTNLRTSVRASGISEAANFSG